MSVTSQSRVRYPLASSRVGNGSSSRQAESVEVIRSRRRYVFFVVIAEVRRSRVCHG
jgi:hypothetical protein